MNTSIPKLQTLYDYQIHPLKRILSEYFQFISNKNKRLKLDIGAGNEGLTIDFRSGVAAWTSASISQGFSAY